MWSLSKRDYTFRKAIATDNCGILESVKNDAPSNLAMGVTNVKWTATDLKGNSSSCVQTVTIYAFACKYPSQVYHRDTTLNSAKIKWKAQASTCANSAGYELRIQYELSPEFGLDGLLGRINLVLVWNTYLKDYRREPLSLSN